MCVYLFEAPAWAQDAAQGPVQAEGDARWPALQAHYFGDARLHDGQDLFELDVPKRAHDASAVPVVLKVLDSSRHIRRVHLIVDQNPLPLAGVFHFSEQATGWSEFETRIRIDQYTHLRAIAELGDGSLHQVAQFVKAAGGCSAPAMGDQAAAVASAGAMKLLIDEASDVDQSTTAQAMASRSPVASQAVIRIRHPNNSGMQFDQVSRNYIPAFYVHSIGAEVDGQPLLSVETNFSLSENPMIRLVYPPSVDHGELTVEVEDSKGNQYSESARFPAAL